MLTYLKVASSSSRPHDSHGRFYFEKSPISVDPWRQVRKALWWQGQWAWWEYKAYACKCSVPLETGYLREGYIIFGLKSKKMSLYIIHRMITLLMVRFLGVSSGSHGRFFWAWCCKTSYCQAMCLCLSHGCFQSALCLPKTLGLSL